MSIETKLAAENFTERCRKLLTSEPDRFEFTVSRVALETLVRDSERYGESNRTTALDTVMLGRFVTQYDEGSEGFFVDADEVQEVANQVNAALTQHDALISLLRRCSYLLWCAPSGSAHNDLAAKTDAYLSEIGNDA